MRTQEEPQVPATYSGINHDPDPQKKKVSNSPFHVVRVYRNSHYSTASRYPSGDPNERTRNIVISLCGTIVACLISMLLQTVTLFSDAWGRYVVETDGKLISVKKPA